MQLRGLGLFVLLTACRAAPAHTSSAADPPPIEVRPLTPPKVTSVVDAAAPAAPKGTRTPEGFLRTHGTLAKRERHVNVIELPLGTLPIDVDLTGSAAAPTVSARLKRELGSSWTVKDIGATPARSPDGKYALLEGGSSPRELVVAELAFDTRGALSGLGKIVRRAKNPYRTLTWVGPHDLVADDGKAILRVDATASTTATPFVAVGRSPKLFANAMDSREVILDFDPSVAQAVTHHVGSEIYGMRSAKILNLKTGKRRELTDVEKTQEIVDIHLGSERTCVVRFDERERTADRSAPLPPATYLCAPTPWQPEAFVPIFTTKSGAGYLATANKRIVMLVERELHVFDIEAKTDRVYPAPVAYSVAPLDDKAKYMLSPGPHPLVLDVEAETIDALDAWVPPDVGGYSTSVLPSVVGDTKLRIFVETHGDRFQTPPPNARRLFILEME